VTAVDDPRGGRIVHLAGLLGVTGLVGCRVSRVYYLQGDLSMEETDRLSREVLVDPVVDEVTMGSPLPASHPVVEVAPRPGVTDVEARELERAAAALGLPPVRASTARRYELIGDLDEAAVSAISRRLLANEIIELHSLGAGQPCFDSPASGEAQVNAVKLDGLTDADLLRLSREGLLSLDLGEMRAIRDHFEREGRDPTDAELETLAQTWSEHCMHKTFRARIRLEHTKSDGSVAFSSHEGLLAALREVTEEIDPPWLRSAFDDNAGIVAFDDHFDLAFKVETHNHPSALEPFGGANTGIGGVVRDVMGVSARNNKIHVAIAAWPWPAYFSPEARMKGIRLQTTKWRRPSPECAPVQAKAAGLYMICTLAKHEAEDGGYDDALMLDWRGQISESTGANIFLNFDGALHTPTADCFLSGITRQTVMDLAGRRGIAVIERAIMPDELDKAIEVFVTGTAAEVTPVGEIDDHEYTVGEITKQLMEDYDAIVRRKAAA